MNRTKATFTLIILIGTIMLAVAGIAQAQSDERGSIRGSVYRDVNGDGVCVNTGVQGEDPVPNIPIEFVSSDEAAVVNLKTGDDGTYGLVAAGQSIWRVTAKPAATDGVITTENPLFAPVLPEEGLIQTGYNFCIAGGATGTIVGSGTGTGNAVIILPESGAPAANSSSFILLIALLGGTLVLVGAAFEWRRRQAAL